LSLFGLEISFLYAHGFSISGKSLHVISPYHTFARTMNYLVCDNNLLGRYCRANFKAYPEFHLRGCSSSVLLSGVLNQLVSPRVVVVASLGSLIASAGSMEPPTSRQAAISSTLQHTWATLTTFSEANPASQVQRFLMGIRRSPFFLRDLDFYFYFYRRCFY
jgi:hypothetical protein